MAETDINDEDMRLVLSGAAQTLLAYAGSDAFDWQRDCATLRSIVAYIEKLVPPLDALKEDTDERENVS